MDIGQAVTYRKSGKEKMLGVFSGLVVSTAGSAAARLMAAAWRRPSQRCVSYRDE